MGGAEATVGGPPTQARPSFAGWSGSWSSRAAIAVFAAVEAVALALRLRWARGAWFTIDDWDYLAERKIGNVGDLFRPHFQHWSTMIVVVYRALWQVAGLHYLPYELFSIVLYLGAALLVRAVMRRVGVAPWTATLAASLLVFFGAGVENNFFTGVLVFGLIQLMLADHDGPLDRRDYLGLAAGFAALLCSGLAVTMTIVVGIAMLLRRGWRVALFHTVPLGGAYLIWLAAAPKGQSPGVDKAVTLSSVVRFVLIGVQATFGRLGQLTGFGIVLGVLLVAGLVLICAQDGVSVIRTRAAIPVALVAGAIVFLVLTGAVRSGKPAGVFLGASGAERARDPRYTYVVAAMVLPALALAIDALVRRWRALAVIAAALLLVTVPAHIHQYRDDARTFAFSGPFNKELILVAPRMPLAQQLPRGLEIKAGIFGGGGLTLGWLLDNLPSGRIPRPDHISPNIIATETLSFALAPSLRAASGPCRRLPKARIVVLEKGDLLTIRGGPATATYLQPDGGRSQPKPLRRGTVVALAGPLRLRIAAGPGRTILCAG